MNDEHVKAVRLTNGLVADWMAGRRDPEAHDVVLDLILTYLTLSVHTERGRPT